MSGIRTMGIIQVIRKRLPYLNTLAEEQARDLASKKGRCSDNAWRLSRASLFYLFLQKPKGKSPEFHGQFHTQRGIDYRREEGRVILLSLSQAIV